MIHYILQVVAFQLVFLLVFDLFLKKETFHTLNRWYLLATPIASFVLPLINIPTIRENIPTAYIVELPAVIIGNAAETNEAASSFTLGFMDLFLFWKIGVAIAACFFVFKLFKIFKLRLSGNITKMNGFQLVEIPNTTTAFSFLSTIYLGSKISEAQKESILLHEIEHVKGKHSLDLLYFEIIKIIFWFNPLSYTYQSRMRTLQEFIADEKVIAIQPKSQYYQSLLSQVFGTSTISFINTFFNHSLIKKRIIMLQKSKSNRIVQLKYLVLIPLVFGMLVYTSCTDESSGEAYNTANFGSESNSEIIQNIDRLTESIAKNGGLTPEEERALEAFKVLTSPQGVDHPDFDSDNEFLEIPFGVIEKVPTYPGCSGTNEELKSCMEKSMMSFVGKNFNVDVAPKGLSGLQRIYVQFKIDAQGKVTNIKARAPHLSLKEEAIRVISSLPDMQAGEQSGKKVSVLYSLPIKFEIKE
ncbi:MAG: M56 family metallopeptidase [Patiriisocius sp.]|uniref:M56 family metallopeptidase n=1 Tax=Patiriisocius sp. TaxID=2822396 RepID=UPI003EF95EE2